MKNLFLKRQVLETILATDLSYMTDTEIEELFDKENEDCLYYINELESTIKEYKIEILKEVGSGKRKRK